MHLVHTITQSTSTTVRWPGETADLEIKAERLSERPEALVGRANRDLRRAVFG